MNKNEPVATPILMLMVLAFTAVPAGAAPATLVGTTNYYTYAVNSQEVLQDLDCPATAVLTFLDDQKFELALTEGGVCGDRTVVKGHTGCVSLEGPFPVFGGSFDGQRFSAESTFDCEIPEHWPDNYLFETPVEGLLNW
jgi:hypothetical protein